MPKGRIASVFGMFFAVTFLSLASCASMGQRGGASAAYGDGSASFPYGFETWPYQKVQYKSGLIKGEKVTVRTTTYWHVERPEVGSHMVVVLDQVGGTKTQIPSVLQWTTLIGVDGGQSTYLMRTYVWKDGAYTFVKDGIVRPKGSPFDR